LILKEFGGDIVCKSTWGEGSNFILLLPFNEKSEANDIELMRIFNPIKITYTKIKIKKSIPIKYKK